MRPPKCSERRALMSQRRRLMRPLRIAIIGFGKIAGDQHLPAINANPRLRIRRQRRAARAGVRSRTSRPLTALLASGIEMDAVAITTPPSVALRDRPPVHRRRACTCCWKSRRPSRLARSRILSCLAEARGHDLVHDLARAAQSRRRPRRRRRSPASASGRCAIIWHEDVRKWHPGQAWIWQPGGFGVFDPGINAFSIITRIFPGACSSDSATSSFPKTRDTPIAAEIEF